jgi:hypothetical protein
MQLILGLLKPLISVIGSTLFSMLTSLLTGPILKRLIVHGLEAEVKKYEDKAAKTDSTEDDLRAEMFRKVLEDAKKAWNYSN